MVLISDRRRSSVFSFSEAEEEEASRMVRMDVIDWDLDILPRRHSSTISSSRPRSDRPGFPAGFGDPGADEGETELAR